MANDSDLLSALPRTRPHRRSAKRPARAGSNDATGEKGGASAVGSGGTTGGGDGGRTAVGDGGRTAAGDESPTAAADGGRTAVAGGGRTAAGDEGPTAAADGGRTLVGSERRGLGGPADAIAPAAKRAAARGAKAPTSAKRSAGSRTRPLRQPDQPLASALVNASRRPASRSPRPAPPNRSNALGTAVQAVAELAEISLSLSARALRNAVDRLPRP